MCSTNNEPEDLHTTSGNRSPMKSNNTVLGSALAELQQRLTAELIAVTIEQPGYATFGFTTKDIVKRNVYRWRQSAAQRLARKGGS